MDLGIRIDENAPVRKLIEICDELDYTDLDDHAPLRYTD